MIKAILWDIDGTILDFLASQASSIRKRFDEYNLGECSDTMLDRYSQINQHYWELLEKQEVTKQEVLVNRFVDFFNEMGIDSSLAEKFNSDYENGIPDNIVFLGNSMDVLQQLKGKVKQYAVTNGAYSVQEKRLRLSKLDQVFDGVFISDSVGYEKPSVDFFNFVFDNIDSFDKDEIMIVGDSLTSDMRGGNNAGIKCCWFNPNKNINNQGVKIDYEITNLNQVFDLL